MQRGVEEAKKQGAKVLVALAAVGRGEAKRIADAVPELTAVVVGSAKSNGDANTTAPQGERVGDVLIAQAGQPPAERRRARPVRARAGSLRAAREVRRRDRPRARRKREDLARRIDELHDEDRRLGAREERERRRPRSARRQELATLEAAARSLDDRPPPGAGQLLPLRGQGDPRGAREGPGDRRRTCARTTGRSTTTTGCAFADRLPEPAAAGPGQLRGHRGVHELPRRGRARSGTSTSHAHAYATLSHAVQGVQPRLRELPRHRLRAAGRQHGDARRQA